MVPEWREAFLAVRVRRLRCFMAAAAVEEAAAEAAEAAAVLRAAAAELGSDEMRADAHASAVLATVERESARVEAALDAGQQQALARRWAQSPAAAKVACVEVAAGLMRDDEWGGGR